MTAPPNRRRATMRASPERHLMDAAAPLVAAPRRALLAPRPRTLALLLLTSSLGACSMFGFGHKPGTTPDTDPTIKTLLTREVVIASDPGIPANEDKAIAAYRNFLAV